MTKPPIQQARQDDYVQTKVRLPADLHAAIQAAAIEHGHSMNAEIIARLEASRADQVAADLAEIKATLRRVLDAVL